MKKIITYLFITGFVIAAIAGCKNNNTQSPKSGEVVEGQVVETRSYFSPGNRIAPRYEATVTDTAGSKTIVQINVQTSRHLNEAFDAERGDKQIFIRMKPDANMIYSISETALLNYDYGTPPIYEFPSDKKRAGFYRQ